LRAFGYSSGEDPVFVQCFDAAELKRLKHELGCELRLIQLVGPELDYGTLLTTTGLRSISAYACGLGPHYSQLVEEEGSRRPRVADLALGARDAGLALHAYTFSRDALPAYAQTLEEHLEFFWTEIGVDGVFCDHPDVAVRVRDSALKVQ